MSELKEWTGLNQRKWVTFQTNMAKSGKVLTRSGTVLPTYLAFRCLYCGEYFNQHEAEEHFGKTREQYIKERADEIGLVEPLEFEDIKLTPKAFKMYLKESEG